MHHSIRKTKGELAGSAANYILLTFISLLCLYPLWYVLVCSFSNSDLLMQHTGPLLKPIGFSLDAYRKVANNPMIGKGYLNTLFILVIGTLFDIVITSLGAYFLSRKNVLFKTPIMIMIIITMFFQGGMIPFYLNLKDLHLTNSLWGLIIPFMINTQNLIILRAGFETVPDSLVESARIDGASHGTVLFSIILPLSKAIIAVITLYYSVSIWNSWFWASAILRDRSMYPLQLILREILLQNSMNGMTEGAGTDIESVAMTIKYATVIVATVPILCVYPFLQRYFTTGVLLGAVKG